MIVKIPIYFEIDSKFPPDQVNELIGVMQSEFTKYLKPQMRRNASIRYLGRDISTVLLSRTEVIQKIGGKPVKTSEEGFNPVL